MESKHIHINTELLQKAAQGDEPSFAALYRYGVKRLGTYLLQLTRSQETAEEITQEVFISLWRSRQKLAEIRDFDNYLFIVARNRAMSEFRRLALEKKLHTTLRQANDQTTNSFAIENEEAELRRKLQACHQQAIEQLPARQKQVYLLSRESDLSRKEIAEKLGIAPETVKASLAAAVRSVQAHMKTEMGTLYFLALLFFSKFY